MAHVVTKDPFGFVGAHVVQHAHAHARRGRRRQRSTSTANTNTTSHALKPDPGAAAASTAASDDESDGDQLITTRDGLFVLHGWITRYDVRLDAYTLFIPGTGTSLHARGDVMKFISNPEFQLRRVTDDGLAPPIEDTTSRFVDAPVLRYRVRGKKRPRLATGRPGVDDGDGVDDSVAGRVACYLPFTDQYRAVYEDGVTAELTESEMVDGVVAFARHAREALAQLKTTDAATRKRRRGQRPATPVVQVSQAAATSISNNNTAVDDDGEETEDEAPPVAVPTIKKETIKPPPRGDDHHHHEDAASQVVQVDATAWENDASVALPGDAPTANRGEIDDDEPMELLPLDDDDDDNVAPSTVSSAAPPATSATTTPIWVPDIVALAYEDDEVMEVTPPVPIPEQLARFYSPPTYTHVATAHLEKRTAAFDVVRAELAVLIESDEARALETALVADVLANKDIKARDAVRRFVETGGLVVLNTVLNARASDALARPEHRYDHVLRLLKVLAMLPTPSERQVMESSIGKTLGRLIKARFREQSTTADTRMPKCIAHLAKWIKHRWIATMKREAKPTAASTVAASTTTSRPTAVPKKHLQRPIHGRPNGHRSNDPEPIPRLVRGAPPRSPMFVPPPPPPPPPVVPFGVSQPKDILGSALASPRANKSSLKPDWMRQKDLLTRTRFTINADATAERQHYQRATPQHQPHNNAPPSQTQRVEEDPGERGVFDRAQRLSFTPRWNVCEFFKDAPPSAVRRSDSAGSTRGSSRGSPRPILRKASKYREPLGF